MALENQLSQLENLKVYDSARNTSPALEEFQEVFRYRNLIYQLVRRDIVARYKRSALGIAWTMLNPLGMMIILTLVFSQMFHTIEGYAAYVLSGLIAWNFFSQTTSAAINSLVWGGDFFRRIYVPRSVFAISAIGTGIVNLVLSIVPLVAVMFVVGIPLRVSAILLPVPILLIALFSLGVGLFISSLAIYFPDVVEMYQIVLMAWMYLTPILYPLEILPKILQRWIIMNPMYLLIRLFRLPIYDGTIPTWSDILPATIASIVIFVIGWWIFSRKSDEFAYRT